MAILRCSAASSAHFVVCCLPKELAKWSLNYLREMFDQFPSARCAGVLRATLRAKRRCLRGITAALFWPFLRNHLCIKLTCADQEPKQGALGNRRYLLDCNVAHTQLLWRGHPVLQTR